MYKHTVSENKNIGVESLINRAEYAAIFNCIIDAILFVDPQRNIVNINPAFTSMFGYTLEEIAGQTPLFIYADPEHYSNQGQQRFNPEAVIDQPVFENEYRRKDGTTFFGETTGVHVFDESGGLLGYVAIIHDITKRKQAQQKEEKLENWLRQSQKMSAIGTMAGGIAHDFNNLLTIISSNLDLLQLEQQAGAPIDKNLENIRGASIRAKNLVAQILAFSRQEQTELVSVNLTTFVGESLKFLRPMIPTTVELMTEALKDPIHIKADTTRLQQVLINLFSNALHAMNAKGLLQISLAEGELTSQEISLTGEKRAGRYAKLTVADTGKGMDEKTLDQIFDPFFTTKGVGEGTGLGLSVVHGIIEQHGGFIQVDSTPGQGTTFILYFPTTSEIEAMEKTEAETIPPTGTERILFVDDEQSVANVCGSMLGHLGYKVTIMTSSVEALDLFRAGSDDFDLVITDQTMPKMSGIELSREILKIRPNLPIILCSGYSAQVTDDDALEIGISAFCMKPVGMKQLAAVSRETLDTRKKPSITGR